MNEVEAKVILANYTLGEPPFDDPRFDEAWRIAKSNPELMAWWGRSKQRDSEIRDRLLEFEPPNDLKAALVASVENVAKSKARRRSVMKYLAWAASLALAFNLYYKFGIDRSDEYTGPLVERAFNYSFDGPRLSYFNKDTTKITDWLEAQDFDLPGELPPRFLAQKGIGCRPLKWSESKVAIICVDAEVVYHLFIARSEEFENLDLSDEFQYEQRKAGWTICKWESNGYSFVLSAKANQASMESMLAEYVP